jgi:hypothetical protein
MRPKKATVILSARGPKRFLQGSPKSAFDSLGQSLGVVSEESTSLRFRKASHLLSRYSIKPLSPWRSESFVKGPHLHPGHSAGLRDAAESYIVCAFCLGHKTPSDATRVMCTPGGIPASAGEVKMQDGKATVPVGANGASIYAVQ